MFAASSASASGVRSTGGVFIKKKCGENKNLMGKIAS